jgi:DNA-directed RNA polymerase specialized sigma24 family protein
MRFHYDNHVRFEFDCYCKKVLRGTAREHFREQKKKAGRETLFSELSVRELSGMASMAALDTYATDATVFDVCGENISILDDALAEALRRLDSVRRSIVLLSFFFGLKDREIAECMNMVRRTVTYRRTSSLRELRKIMEGIKDE